MEAARIVVAHAGMGSILMAAEAGKPIVILPRRADLGEHRNDHQLDTAAEMSALSNVHVVEDAAQLGQTLSKLLATAPTAAGAVPSTAQPQLLAALREFIWTETRQPQRSRLFTRRVAS
jgi:UDP-N-acetylglucosamine transferase subunit ALG13